MRNSHNNLIFLKNYEKDIGILNIRLQDMKKPGSPSVCKTV